MIIGKKKIFIIVIFAFILRTFLPLYLEVKESGYHERNVNEIEFYYDDVARSLISGNGFVHSVNPNIYTEWKFEPGTPFSFVPPLYVFFIYVVYLFFGPNVFYAKIFTALLDSLVCLIVYLVGKRIFTKEILPLISSFLYSIYPLSILMASTLYYQIVFNLALCFLLLCLLYPVNFKNGVLTGFAFGLSSLAKPVALPLLFLLPFVRVVEVIINKDQFSNIIKWSFSFFVVGILTLVPWTIRNYIVFDEFVPVQKGGPEAFFQGSKSEYIDIDVVTLRSKFKDDFVNNSTMYRRAISNHIAQFESNPLSYFGFLMKKFGYAWYNTEGKEKNFKVLLVQVPFLFFALIGLVVSFRFIFLKYNYYVIIILAYIVGIQVLFFPLMRYTLAIMPMVLIYSAIGIYYIVNCLLRRVCDISSEFKN